MLLSDERRADSDEDLVCDGGRDVCGVSVLTGETVWDRGNVERVGIHMGVGMRSSGGNMECDGVEVGVDSGRAG